MSNEATNIYSTCGSEELSGYWDLMRLAGRLTSSRRIDPRCEDPCEFLGEGGTRELWDETFWCEGLEKVDDFDPPLDPLDGGRSMNVFPSGSRYGSVSVILQLWPQGACMYTIAWS
jgi:hypothetical protein